MTVQYFNPIGLTDLYQLINQISHTTTTTISSPLRGRKELRYNHLLSVNGFPMSSIIQVWSILIVRSRHRFASTGTNCHQQPPLNGSRGTISARCCAWPHVILVNGNLLTLVKPRLCDGTPGNWAELRYIVAGQAQVLRNTATNSRRFYSVNLPHLVIEVRVIFSRHPTNEIFAHHSLGTPLNIMNAKVSRATNANSGPERFCFVTVFGSSTTFQRSD